MSKVMREEMQPCLWCLTNQLKAGHKRTDYCRANYKSKKDVPWNLCAISFHAIRALIEHGPEMINIKGAATARKAGGQLHVCGNCKYFKTLSIIPFVKGWYVGDGRCQLGKRSLRNGTYKTVGDTCSKFVLNPVVCAGLLPYLR